MQEIYQNIYWTKNASTNYELPLFKDSVGMNKKLIIISVD